MTENVPFDHRWNEPIVKMKVRAADSCRTNFHDSVALIEDLWIRYLFDAHNSLPNTSNLLSSLARPPFSRFVVRGNLAWDRFSLFEFARISRPSRPLIHISITEKCCVRNDDFSNFHDLFETSEVIVELLFGFFAEKFCNSRTDHSNGWIVLKVHFHDRSTSTWCLLKLNGACVIDIRIFQRSPRDDFSRFIGDDHGVPFHFHPRRSLSNPMGSSIPGFLD